jgi:hypothetical protein
MIIASMCTIPLRKDAFKQVAQRILQQQTLPVDQLHVWLNGYKDTDGDLPQDPRLIYHLEPSNPGPWVRYKVGQSLSDQDYLITLDDDLDYPENYVETGIKALEGLPCNTVLSYGGIIWDPLVNSFSYSTARQLFTGDHDLDNQTILSLPMGGTCFFRAGVIRHVLDNFQDIFYMNDDMLVGLYLQKTGNQIVSVPRPGNWIKQLDVSHASHALYNRDRNNRQRVFHRMVYRMGFEPSAGLLQSMLEKSRHIVVIAGVCPPLPGSDLLDVHLRKWVENCVGVHLLSWTFVSNSNLITQHVNVPYYVHTVQALDPAGRLDDFKLVQTWREWRIVQDFEKKMHSRLNLILNKLRPQEIYAFENNRFIPLRDDKEKLLSSIRSLSPRFSSS